ncbi:MAG: hypothetical protein M3O30_00925 [Planctomycetota bacterium]|nr:hypothetical protein [Planctomycetota bacterium]
MEQAIQSHFVTVSFFWEGKVQGYRVETDWGRLWWTITFGHDLIADENGNIEKPALESAPWYRAWGTFIHRDGDPEKGILDPKRADSSIRCGGFVYWRGMVWQTYYHAYGIPLWWFTIITGILPARSLVRRWRHSKWRGSNRCSQCGYDLRASPIRCPECGTVRLPEFHKGDIHNYRPSLEIMNVPQATIINFRLTLSLKPNEMTKANIPSSEV